eukprot:752402-Hanusia_phi.AAC.4
MAGRPGRARRGPDQCTVSPSDDHPSRSECRQAALTPLSLYESLKPFGSNSDWPPPGCRTQSR